MRFRTSKLVPGEECVEISDARVFITTPRGKIEFHFDESDITSLRQGNPILKNGVHFTPVKSRYREVLLIEFTPEDDPIAIALDSFLFSLEVHLKAVDSI